MLKEMATNVGNGNEWGPDEEHPSLETAVVDLQSITIKLLFALPYFMLFLAGILASPVKYVVVKWRTALADRQSRKLKNHLDWARPAEESRKSGRR